MQPQLQLQLQPKHFNTALRYAARSGIKSYLTGAVVVKAGREIASGWSHYSELSLANYRSIHAELHAILRTPQKQQLVNADIYIATIRNKSRSIGHARPCEHCLALIDEVGIRRIYYTIEGNETGYIDLNLVP